MFQSPLKTVSEKIKPTTSKSSISSLNFDRSSDFKKFMNFLKVETKELEKIKLPKMSEVKPAGKRKGVLGLFGIGILGLLASAFDDDEGGDKGKLFPTAGGTASQFKEVGLPLIRGLQDAPDPSKFRGRKRLSKKLFVREKIFKDIQKNNPADATKKKTIQRKRKFYGKRMAMEGKILAKNKMIEKSIYEKELLALNNRYTSKFDKLKTMILNNYKKKLKIEDAPNDIVEDIIETNLKINLDEEIHIETKEALKKEATKRGVAFIDPKVNSSDELMQQIKQSERFKKLSEQVNKPTNIDDINELEKIIKDPKTSSAEKAEVRKLLNDPEVRKMKKETKFQRIQETYKEKGYKFKIAVPEAQKFFKETRFEFKPKYVLDDLFTGIGESTKSFREGVAKNFSKLPIPKGSGSLGSVILKNAGKGLDIINATYETFKLAEGFVVGDNILTALYDLFVSIENTIQPDKTRLKTFITNSRDPRINAFKRQKNQKILDQIKKARQAQPTNNNVSSNNKTSSIIPNSKQVTGQMLPVLATPSYVGFKFIMEKLYKQ